MIPVGFCQCGCGEPTAICDRNWKRFGYVKGEPFKYLPSHNRRARREANIYRNTRRPGGANQHEHVVIAEKALGRPLPAGAQVHHVDENRRNNAPSNLVICENQAYHLLLHRRARVVRHGGDPNTQGWCSRCGLVKAITEFNKGQRSNCRECQSKYFKTWKRNKEANWRDIAIMGGDLGL